jgi:adenosine deaminase
LIDRRLPLIDLHRHLDGNVRLETILELTSAAGVPLPVNDVEGLRRLVRVDRPLDDLMEYLSRFTWLTGAMVDEAACRRIAYENVEDALGEGVDYLELRFSPWFMAEPHGLEPQAVVEAVVDGVTAGSRDTGVEAGLIGILSRTYGPDICLRELDALLAHASSLAGLDLAGDEARFPPELFADHFGRARASGLQITVHAGESAGPESVWKALRVLGARRIGHGVRAIDDPALVEHLATERIGVESCLTSNVHTRTVPSYAAHPLARFLEAGVPATINTDDPAISGIDLRHEYEVAAPAAGLTPEQIQQAQENALEVAFISDGDRRRLQRRAQDRQPSGPPEPPF